MSIERILQGNTTFYYYDKQDPTYYCVLEVKVVSETVINEKGDTIEYYDVSYFPRYSHNNMLRAYYCNPLHSLDEIKPNNNIINLIHHEHYAGDIVVKNSMTDILIYYILMDFEQLATHCGNICPRDYKIRIMLSLNLFRI